MDLAISGYGVVDKPVLVWFTILVAVTLQTSFLTPPVGYALFYMRVSAPWCGNERHLQRHNSFCNSSAHSYLFSFSMAGSGHLATGVCLRLILYEWGY